MHKFPAAPFLILAGVLSCPGVSLAVDPVCGDVNRSGSLSASDALAVLKAAVGQPVNLQCPVVAAPLQSGQTACSDGAGGPTSCNDTGQDGDLRLGVTPGYADNGSTITDNRTGLVWEVLSNDGSIHDRDDKYTWAAAFSKIDALNSANFAGHNDWRLPNVVELRTLLDMGINQPATRAEFDTNCSGICSSAECSCTQPDYYWTSTSYDLSPDEAWYVDFYDGYTESTTKSDPDTYVRAVRGGS
jgi:hypothetical protein